MRSLLAFTLVTLIAPVAHAAKPDASVNTNPSQTEALLSFLGKQDTSFADGMHMGIQSMGMEVECSNADPASEDVKTMKCYARALTGFSQLGAAPVPIDDATTTLLVDILSKNDAFQILIGDGIQGLDARVMCSFSADGSTTSESSCLVNSDF